jgi:UDP-N-acetylglucosamine 2-epimerase (non-hydrolysing)
LGRWEIEDGEGITGGIAISRVKKILLVVSARPNFMKIAPVLEQLNKVKDDFRSILVHTGQHYDALMSDVFFDDLGLPGPDYHLGVGSGSHPARMARTLVAFEEVLAKEHPDLVVVAGDVDPTLACALNASWLHLPVAHIEAGLRSRDRRMPEEITRILTDALSRFLFTPSADADENLAAEGVSPDRIFRVGNVMIDSLRRLEPVADASDILDRLGLEAGSYGLVTLHRPSNVDDPAVLAGILGALSQIQARLPLVFAQHPRTRKQIEAFHLSDTLDAMQNLVVTAPLGYIEMLKIQKRARLVLTDSGGLQEETTAFGVPCLTLRENTERPVTIEEGTNRLVGVDPNAIVQAADAALAEPCAEATVPDLWDGRAAERIVEVIRKHI